MIHCAFVQHVRAWGFALNTTTFDRDQMYVFAVWFKFFETFFFHSDEQKCDYLQLIFD